MTEFKGGRKGIVLAGLLASLMVASIKGRRPHGEAENLPIVPANPLRLSLAELKNVFYETFKALGAKNMPSLAAGVAYFSTLALFPMLAAVVAIAALLITPDQLDSFVATVRLYLPEDISGVIGSQLENLVSKRSDNYLAAAIAIAIALFGASGASKNLVIASNVVYGAKESRGWLAQQAWGVLWTAAGVAFSLLLVALLAVNNTLLEYFGFPPSFITTLLYGRWVAILLLTVLGLSFFYKHGPNRPHVRWQWINPGAVIATTVWTIATFVFFVYVQNFADYGQSYSLFAGIIILMIWMNLSALIVLLGAEINHQLEVVNRRNK